MLRVVENDLILRGFRILTLNVGKDNPSAVRFYERIGFRILHSDEGRWSYIDHKGMRRSVSEPAWRMEKYLSKNA
jgi:ribosomal protein S18 acetylase RimI-like enzyme